MKKTYQELEYELARVMYDLIILQRDLIRANSRLICMNKELQTYLLESNTMRDTLKKVLFERRPETSSNSELDKAYHIVNQN